MKKKFRIKYDEKKEIAIVEGFLRGPFDRIMKWHILYELDLSDLVVIKKMTKKKIKKIIKKKK